MTSNLSSNPVVELVRQPTDFGESSTDDPNPLSPNQNEESAMLPRDHDSNPSSKQEKHSDSNHFDANLIGQQGLNTHLGHGSTDDLLDDLLDSSEDDKKNVSPQLKRRIRMVAFLVLLALYFVLVIGFYCGSQDWEFIDAIYFAIVVMTTVGYGDNPPITSKGARVFTGFIVIYAVGIISTAVTFLIYEIMRIRDELKKKNRQKRLQCMCDDPLKKEMTSDVADDSGSISPRTKLVIKLFWIICVYGSGLIAFMNLEHQELDVGNRTVDEGYSFADAFYFVCVTSTTVGFGDLSFTTTGGKAFACFWLLVAAFTTAGLFSELANYLVGNDKVEDILDDELDEHFFDELDKFGNGDGKVTMDEWMSFVLHTAGYVDKEILDRIKHRFKMLDLDENGSLTTDDFLTPFREARVVRESQIANMQSNKEAERTKISSIFRSSKVVPV